MPNTKKDHRLVRFLSLKSRVDHETIPGMTGKVSDPVLLDLIQTYYSCDEHLDEACPPDRPPILELMRHGADKRIDLMAIFLILERELRLSYDGFNEVDAYRLALVSLFKRSLAKFTCQPSAN